jgi:hypothetical protein
MTWRDGARYLLGERADIRQARSSGTDLDDQKIPVIPVLARDRSAGSG